MKDIINLFIPVPQLLVTSHEKRYEDNGRCEEDGRWGGRRRVIRIWQPRGSLETLRL